MPTLQQLVDGHERIAFFGGAGVSTESGIPDFRGATGLYRERRDVPAEVMLSSDFFAAHPREFYAFYREKILRPALRAQPNGAHKALARLEAAGRLTGVVTQNIDGLHQAAGSRRVFELHGSIYRNYCPNCGRRFAVDIVRGEGLPRCPCGGLVRPDVVLYGEMLDEETVEGALEALESADLLIVGGTSLSVYPAASFLDAFHGDALVVLNRDPTPRDREAALVLRTPIAQALGELRL